MYVIIGGGKHPYEEYRTLLQEQGLATEAEPFETNRLAKIPCANHRQTSVLSLFYMWLGRVTSKHWKCCTGDCK